MSETQQRGRIIREANITRAMVRAHPAALFCFGDNMRRTGTGGQAKAMRGEPNAIGVVTKWAPSRVATAFFRDSDLDSPAVRSRIDLAFAKLRQALDQGQDVYIAQAGLGTGMADLPTQAPRIARYIDEQLARLEHPEPDPATRAWLRADYRRQLRDSRGMPTWTP